MKMYWSGLGNINLPIPISGRKSDKEANATVFKLNKNTAQLILTDTENDFTVVRDSDDTVGSYIKLKKVRTTGGQTLTGDTLGEMQFVGVDGSSVEYVMAKIKSASTDDVTVHILWLVRFGQVMINQNVRWLNCTNKLK